jgi:hypothetical protein
MRDPGVEDDLGRGFCGQEPTGEKPDIPGEPDVFFSESISCSVLAR